MNKTIMATGSILLVAFGVGLGSTLVKPWLFTEPAMTEAMTSDLAAEKPIFYRNPMNPAITSPVPAKDEMGMDYIPVFEDKPTAKAEPIFYRNPMNPAITSPVPAKDEMGMDYIPVFADDNGGDSQEAAGTVKIDPVVVQNIGVRTVRVEKRDMSKQVRATGRISIDESRIARIHPRTEGWVEQQFAARIGDKVDQGDKLLSVYSPQLVTSQEEYLLALDNYRSLQDSRFKDVRTGAFELVQSARQRLRFLDMPDSEIKQLRKTRKVKRQVSIESPFSGVVMNIGARQGQYIMPNTQLYMLADLSKVWVLADVYEYELPWISQGDPASMRITGLGNREFVGAVAFIYPYAESRTRTVQVRLEFDNPEGLLKPDMFTDVTISAGSHSQALVVPSEAIVRSGSREQVFVVRGEGKYEPREVELGYSSDGLVEVRSGLKLGERVVNSALFLIDSESKLREATAKMMEALKAPEPDQSATSMDGMSMKDMSMDGMSMDAMSMDAMSMDGMSMDGMSMDGMSMDGMSAVGGDPSK